MSIEVALRWLYENGLKDPCISIDTMGEGCLLCRASGVYQERDGRHRGQLVQAEHCISMVTEVLRVVQGEDFVGLIVASATDKLIRYIQRFEEEYDETR